MAFEPYVRAFQYEVLWQPFYQLQVVSNRLRFKRSLFSLCPGVRVAVSSFLCLFFLKNFFSEFESFWHQLTKEKMQLSLQNIIVGAVTTKRPSHYLLNYMLIIGKVYFKKKIGKI